MKIRITKELRYTLDGSQELVAEQGSEPDLPESIARWAIRHKYAIPAYKKVAPENKAFSVTEDKGVLLERVTPRKRRSKKK